MLLVAVREEEIGMIEEGQMNVVVVKEYWEERFLPTSQHKSKIEAVYDVGEVEDQESEEKCSTCNREYKDVIVVGIS